MISAPAIKSGAVTPLDPGKGVPNDPKSRVGHIRELFDLSSKWMQDNYWTEFEDVWRAVKVRTKPIMIKKDGQSVEDKNRTNICMPELNLIVRRKTARLTANPPTLNYYVPGEDTGLLAERLTARAFYEFDRSGEAWEFRRLVQQANTFGFTYSKTFLDTVDVQRQMRYQTAKLSDRATVMKINGADPDEIQQSIDNYGPVLSDKEIAEAVAQRGTEMRDSIPFVSYDGPVTKTKFVGDILLEPGCLTLNESGFVIDDYKETSLWLTKMLAKTYEDPENPSLRVPIFDASAVQDLVEQDVELRHDKHDNLRRILRDAIQMNHPYVANRLLPQKRFRVTEYHAPDKDGRLWIEYVGNDSVYLGKQPYPFDLMGKWVYTEYVPWPDLIGAIGDSSPRLLRFLHAMHNATVGQRNDLITNKLQRVWLVSSEEDIPSEQIRRANGRWYVVNDINGIRELQESDVPQSAWETEAQINSEMQKAEPIIGGVEAGGAYNPQASKTATTAILAAKSGDALTQYEIDGLNLYLKETGEKKLEIHRQLADKPILVPNRPQYVKTQALTERFGKTSMIEIDPYELQDPSISVEPVAGSTLAVDDELRAGKIQNIYQMAEADPSVWNKHEAAKLVLTTIKGLGDTSKLLNDPNAQAPAGPKVGANISIPLDKMPADIQQKVFQLVFGEPSADLEASSKMEAVKQLSETADANVNLHSPAKPDLSSAVLAKQQKAVQDKVSATQ